MDQQSGMKKSSSIQKKARQASPLVKPVELELRFARIIAVLLLAL
jgi:hypothetical protein